MSKIKLPTPIWVQFYGELSSYVEEYGSIDCRFDDDGNRLEEYEGEYESIVDEVENIMSKFFVKGDINETEELHNDAVIDNQNERSRDAWI